MAFEHVMGPLSREVLCCLQRQRYSEHAMNLAHSELVFGGCIVHALVLGDSHLFILL